MKNYKAYMFWYTTSASGPTEYIYVIAVSEKQAQYFFDRYRKEVLGYVYDYDTSSCCITECYYRHQIGDIIGHNAIV